MESSTDHDVLPPITIYDAQTVYHTLVVPASMRSQYWKYFGFPADESNNIITRDKIVCCICRRQIAYNKNTTNMSTHLIARHIDIMHKYFPNDIKMKPSSTNAKRLKQSKAPQSSQSMTKRIKSEKMEPERWSDDYEYTINRPETEAKDAEKSNKAQQNNESVRVVVTTEDGEEFIETLDYDECPGIFGMESQSLSGDEPNETNQHDFLNEEYLLANVNVDNDVSSQAASQDGDQEKIFIDVYVDKSNKRSPKKSTADDGAPAAKQAKLNREHREPSKILSEREVAEAMKHFVVSDILSPSIVDGVGFRSYTRSISSRSYIPLPDSSKVAAVIETDFAHKSSAVSHEIESLCKNVWYSLAFDKWIAEDGRENTIISFTHLVPQKNTKIDALKRQIVSILSENCVKYLNKQFKDFTKCSAAVVNWELGEKDSLRTFLQKKKIPIIQSFSCVIGNIVSKCFELPEVELIFQQLTTDDTEQKLLSPCWLTQFSYLEELSESNEGQTDNHLLETIKAITECLRPMKDIFDVLSEEPTTWASMMKPLARSLINVHYSGPKENADGGNDTDKLINSMKAMIVNNLNEKITSNWFLTVACFLDPRFHGSTSPEDRERIQANFSKNSKDEHTFPIKLEPAAAVSPKNETLKRNRLSALFANFPVGQNPKTSINPIETEVRSYTEDVNVDIDHCPLSWWSTCSKYPNLKRHVQQYFSASLFVNELYRLSLAEQLRYRENCKKVTDEIGRKIVWLYINASNAQDDKK